ncbi:MAG TPA: alpha/beta hydrolase, partial [Chitinophagaceae bacterium]|nr:alpha/beta hydrolase [Chitinophagaceae bacterium]
MKIFLPALCILLLAACHQSENINEEAIGYSGDKHEVYNGLVNLAYNISGSADTTLLFVHGWCINKEYFSSQADYFGKRYKVVTMDLGGHGKSGKQRFSWGVQNYASDVVTVIDSLALSNVILVGHSMGGDIILEAALQRPNKVIGCIGIDNFKDVTPQYKPEQIGQIAQFMTAVHKNFYNTAEAYSK